MTEDEEDTAFTDDEEETALTDEEDVAFADEEDTFEELLLDSPLLLRMTLDDDDFLTLELDGDPGTESGMTSEGEVPLSPPQAARATERIMDAIMLYLNFLILNLVHIPNCTAI
jgi:hypothetical protein